MSAMVVPSPGILKQIGENLPNPKKMLPLSGMDAAAIQTVLRQDLIAGADRAVGAPTAPPLPSPPTRK
jgi:hypothetical protein